MTPTRSIYIKIQKTPPDYAAVLTAIWHGTTDEHGRANAKEEPMILAWNTEHDATRDGHCKVSLTHEKQAEGDHPTEMHMQINQPLSPDPVTVSTAMDKAIKRIHACVVDYHVHIKKHFEDYKGKEEL